MAGVRERPVGPSAGTLPDHQITLVSIIVALSLEQLLDLLPTIDVFWTFTWDAVAVWSQAIVAFAII